MMPAPICVKCRLTMRVKRNGQPIVICEDHSRERPYQVRFADVYKCHFCGATVAVGMGGAIERHEDGFARELAAAGPTALRVY